MITSHNPSPHKRGRGFSLVEVLLAIGIMGVGLAMVAAVFPVAMKETQDSSNTSLGTIICSNGLATAKTMMGSAVVPLNPTAAGAYIRSGDKLLISFERPDTSLTGNDFLRHYLEFTAGPFKGNCYQIVSAGSARVDIPWTSATLPDASSRFRIVRMPRGDWGFFPAQSTGIAKTLFDAVDKGWAAKQHWGLFVYIPGPARFILVGNCSFILPEQSRLQLLAALPSTTISYNMTLGTTERYHIVFAIAPDGVRASTSNDLITDLSTFVHPDLLRYPYGMANSRYGTVLFGKKIFGTQEHLLLAAAYNKSRVNNKVVFKTVAVDTVNNDDARGVHVKLLQANAVSLGTPLIMLEDGSYARVIKILDTNRIEVILDRPIHVKGMALVVQELDAANGDAVVPNCPVISVMSTRTGLR